MSIAVLPDSGRCVSAEPPLSARGPSKGSRFERSVDTLPNTPAQLLSLKMLLPTDRGVPIPGALVAHIGNVPFAPRANIELPRSREPAVAAACANCPPEAGVATLSTKVIEVMPPPIAVLANATPVRYTPAPEAAALPLIVDVLTVNVNLARCRRRESPLNCLTRSSYTGPTHRLEAESHHHRLN